MKINLKTQIVDPEGSPLPNYEKHSAPLILKDIIYGSILSADPEDIPESKYQKYDIFKKIRDADEVVDLTPEEVVLIKRNIGRVQPPLIMGQCYDLLT